MKLLTYPAVFKVAAEGGYTVTFPDLSGCFTEGDTLEDAFANAKEAMNLWLEDQDFPKATEVQKVVVSKNDIVMLVEVDAMLLAESKNKSVKKTLTIPEWLNIAAEKEGINFSATLQEALKEKLSV